MCGLFPYIPILGVFIFYFFYKKGITGWGFKFYYGKYPGQLHLSLLPRSLRNVLAITTVHENPDICAEAAQKKKPLVFDFINFKLLAVISAVAN